MLVYQEEINKKGGDRGDDGSQRIDLKRATTTTTTTPTLTRINTKFLVGLGFKVKQYKKN